MPLAPDAADRSFLLKGFEHKNARRHDDVNQCNVAVEPSRGGGGGAATSGSPDLVLLYDYCWLAQLIV